MQDKYAGTAFFPIPIYESGVSELAQCLETGKPIFAKDLRVSRKGAKTFFACGYDHFCNVLYTRWIKRGKGSLPSVYEVIQFNNPSKIFIDIDFASEDEREREKVMSFANDFYQHCLQMAKNSFDLKEEAQGLLLHASFESKVSFHFILQHFVENVEQVKRFVEHAIGTYKDQRLAQDCVDMRIYTKNRCFRLPWSIKVGKNPKTALTPANNSAPVSFDKKVLLKSLVQAIPLEETPIHKFNTTASLKRKRTEGGIESIAIASDLIPQGFIEHYIKLVCSPEATISSTRQSGIMLQCVILHTKCPWISNKKHKSNNQFFNYNTKNGQAWFICSDVNCPKIRYNCANIMFALQE